jgi:hypothetical protein
MAEDKPPSSIVREIAGDGSILIRDERCTCSFRRLRPGTVEMRIVGTDGGQFGTALIDEVALAIVRDRSIELLLDAGDAVILSVGFTGTWARFFDLNRPHLERVTVLATSRATALTMGLVRYLSNTGDLIRIHTEREAYEARKSALASPQRYGS